MHSFCKSTPKKPTLHTSLIIQLLVHNHILFHNVDAHTPQFHIRDYRILSRLCPPYTAHTHQNSYIFMYFLVLSFSSSPAFCLFFLCSPILLLNFILSLLSPFSFCVCVPPFTSLSSLLHIFLISSSSSSSLFLSFPFFYYLVFFK